MKTTSYDWFLFCCCVFIISAVSLCSPFIYFPLFKDLLFMIMWDNCLHIILVNVNHYFCQYMSGLLSLWAKMTCVYWSNLRKRKSNHILLVKTGKHHVGLKTVTKPSDSNWHGWVWMHVSVCEHMTHTHNLCCVSVLCSGTCDKLRARGWFLCLLMCNSSQSVVHETSAIYRNNSSLCCILCLRRLWSGFSLQLLTLQWDFY